MMFYSNNIIGTYTPNDEFITITYVLLVGVCFGLYHMHKKLKPKSLSADFNNTKMHSMDNYTFNFKNTEVAVASSAKKISVVTKILVWGLITLFVVTPFYEIVTTMEPVNNFGYGFMNCFRF